MTPLERSLYDGHELRNVGASAPGKAHADIDLTAKTPARALPWWTPVAASARAGMRLATGGALGLWLADVALLASAGGAVGWVRWLTAMASSLFVALTTALVLGAVLGPLVVPTVDRIMSALRAPPAPIGTDELEAQHTLAARWLSIALLAAVAGSVAYRISLVVVVGLARPASMAAALTLSHLTLGALVTAVWPAVTLVAGAVVRGAGRVPVARWFCARGWRVLLLIGAGVLLAAGCALLRARAELLALPWSEIASLPGLAIGLAVSIEVIRRRTIWAKRTVRVMPAVTWILLLVSAMAASRLRPTSTVTRKLAFERALSGRWGYAAWTMAFDFDGDGQLGILGGGDCAQFDRQRYLGAIDIPGNGIDEDCDGEDLSIAPILPQRKTVAVHNSLPYRPSVVLVTIDGLSAQRLVALGNGPPLMPHVDELAQRSMLFANCFSQGPSTRLSFPSLFTSRWDSQLTRLPATRLPYPLAPSERQLQDVLNAAGYETIAVIPNGYFDREHWSSVTRGFQQVDGSAIPFGKNNAPQVTDAAIHALTVPHDRPVYLWVHYFDAHGPYEAIPGVTYATRSQQEFHNAELTNIDHELARLFAALDARSEPAYVVLTSDHGTVFHPNPSSRRYHYGYDLYSATLHVPLLIRGPNLKTGRVEELTSLMDVAPTITDLLGLPNEDLFEGASVAEELLTGRHEADDRFLFHEFYLPERDFRGEDPLQIASVRNRHWNLVLDRERGHFELYDWTADYFEQRDLYEEQSRSPEVVHLRSLVSAFIQQVHHRAPGTASLSTPGFEH